MRQFVLIGHDVPTEPDFSLDDLAGGAGRLDALCRSITAAFVTSHGIREDVRVHLIAQDELTITFDGGTLKRLNPDEQHRRAGSEGPRAPRGRHRCAARRTQSGNRGLPPRIRGTLEEIADDGPIVQLHEDGEAVVDVGAETLGDAIFVLSDHRDFTDEEAGLLEAFAEQRLRLGPELLHADQAITIAHHYLDTDGYERF